MRGDLLVEVLDVDLGPRQLLDVVADRRLEAGDLFPRPVDVERQRNGVLGVSA